MENNLVQNLNKISGALPKSDYQNEAAHEKLVMMGLFLFLFGITVWNLQSFCMAGGEQREIKSDPKIRVHPGVRFHPNDSIRGPNHPHKY